MASSISASEPPSTVALPGLLIVGTSSSPLPAFPDSRGVSYDLDSNGVFGRPADRFGQDLHPDRVPFAGSVRVEVGLLADGLHHRFLHLFFGRGSGFPKLAGVVELVLGTGIVSVYINIRHVHLPSG